MANISHYISRNILFHLKKQLFYSAQTTHDQKHTISCLLYGKFYSVQNSGDMLLVFTVM